MFTFDLISNHNTVGMDRWNQKVALVTGASAGIGAAIAEEFVKNGMKVVGLARRVERVEELRERLKNEKGELFPLKGDVSKTEEIEAAFEWIEDKFGTIHVLVNNAGIGRPGTISEGKLDHLHEVINVNLVGVVTCTQKALQLMKKSGVDDGHIFNINSIAGHYVPYTPEPMLNVYTASKYGVTAFTETLRQELVFLKSKIRITSISPGAVATEIWEATNAAAEEPVEVSEARQEFFMDHPFLESKDIADSVIQALSAPAHVNIQEIMIKPVGQKM